ncbi:D-isomer specific 2-hydroxyacid dehydrogenase NAD-binding protein [Pseudopedobacter saltans DSM 12145]|uniref:D-isomer specific 2-hydroxyacid dehydrogenase NAD-binding protein n=1 Tax=Pseudopedobacter saltans (strain ATCC 51119 / DSM 12145 / JCM 21818 / CCUG 39354 / LMG 10337 / NBRC 100064 / NCIMB 13643) TaxID=762903 RepID=F0S541_PSESL|nr:NAD(P)-dependent oxidoreductase [Pseudopedobacter saltans]ADY50958.1 D-isomer specific 2-hydroxyacid dehydrogenase NAD-binding protein [Pseudopedobacter saltans DSM 12145]
MKAIVYSTKTFEKELLAKANFKKHDITLISNPLNIETVSYAEGKDAVIVSCNDDLSTPVIDKLAEFGIKYISTRSGDVENINRDTAAKYGIKIAHVPYTSDSVAEHVLTLVLALSRNLITTIERISHSDFNLEGLTGFNLKGKTIGLIGYSDTGLATSKLFHNVGCRVLIADKTLLKMPEYGEVCDLDYLLENSDIISLHVSFKNKIDKIINRESIYKMKSGVMLINTSRGGLLNISDVLDALKSGQLGYLGADIFENDIFIFSEDKGNTVRNPIYEELLSLSNVIITPRQALLTKETIEEIAFQTIRNLDNWQARKCVGKACACPNDCATKH